VWIKHNKILLSKILLLLVMLLVVLSGLTVFGCIGIGATSKGWSGVTVEDGTLFLGSMEGKLVAVDVSTHNRLFPDVTLETSAPTGGGFGCAASSTAVAIYGTPAVAGDLVYVGGYNGKCYAINSISGALRWVYPRQGNLDGHIVGSLVVFQGRVYIGCSDGKLYVLDTATGDKQWEFQTGDKIWSTPAIDGDTLYIGSFDKKLYALDATSGKEKWGEPFETQGAIVSTPLVYNNTVYIGSFDRHVYAVDAINGKQIWQFPAEDETENKPENWFWAKPIAYDNVIYAPCLDGKVYILDAENGHELVDAIDLESPISSSPVLVDSSIIIASEEGLIYSLDTANNQIKPLADVEEKIDAPLCASEGVVYVHTQKDETLYALNAQTGMVLWSLPLSSK